MAVLFTVLALYLIFSYWILRATLKRCIGKEKGQGARSQLSKMFLVFVITYAFTAIYYATYGQYYSLVC